MRRLKLFAKTYFKWICISILAIYFVLTVFGLLFVSRKINFNYELESFFPKGSNELEYYLEHLKRFESDHDVILVALTSNKGIFSSEFLKSYKKVNDSIESLPEVNEIFGPLQMFRLRSADPVPVLMPFLHPNNTSKYEKDSLRLVESKHPVTNFFSFPASSICFVVKVNQGLKIEQANALVKKVTELLHAENFHKVRLAGRVKSQTYIVNKMQKEFVYLSLITAVMLILFLYFTFRNFWGVLLPVLVVSLGMLFTICFILFFSGSLNLISVILPTVLFVVGVSDSVHVLNSYYTELNNGHDKFTAIRMTIHEIGRATFLTAITSAIGFFTLITVNVKPIADFGVFAAIGILLIYIITFTFLISLLYFVKPFYLPENKEYIKHEPFRKLFFRVIRQRKLIAWFFVLALIPLAYGVFNIQVNNYFTEDFRKSDEHKKEFDFFDANFGGVRPYEVSIEMRKGNHPFDFHAAHEIGKFEQFISDSLRVGGLISSNTILYMANQMRMKGDYKAYCLENNDSLHNANVQLIKRYASYFKNKLIDSTESFGRITGRINDVGAIEVRKMHQRLEAFYRREIDTNVFAYRHTGISEIIDGNIRYLTANMMDGLIYELLAIGLLMGLLFRSFKMALLSLVPNVFPLIFIGGIMGIFGINLNVSSSIIFSIAFGITVDDTIHLLGRYKIELSKGLDNKTALLNAYMYSGKAVVMTSIILFSGFSILMLSSFTGIFNTGLLVGLTLFIAVFSDLLLLPLLFLKQKFTKN